MDMLNENGFICNNQAHWFSIRKIGEKWYNLNSTNRAGPEIISDFYFSAFLLSVKQNGYTIFVVKGQYPNNDKELFPFVENYQKYIPVSVIEKIQEYRMKKKKFELNIGSTDDRELKKAMEQSKKEYN